MRHLVSDPRAGSACKRLVLYARWMVRPADGVDLVPENTVELRIHSIGGWDATPAGHQLAAAAASVFDMHVKAFPSRSREKRGQPTTYAAILSKRPLLLNGELKEIDIALSPDPSVFRHSNPLDGISISRRSGMETMVPGAKSLPLFTETWVLEWTQKPLV